MSDRVWTDEEFARMSDQHLPYELLMLRTAAKALNEPEPPIEDLDGNLRRWMAVECFYIHLRSLDQFFYGPRGVETDAIATDFFAEPSVWQGPGHRPKRSRGMDEAVELAGTMVAHLNYRRHGNIEAGRQLKWLKLAQEMNAVYEAFQSALRSENRVPYNPGFSVIPTGLVETHELKYGTATTVSTPGNLTEYLALMRPERKNDAD